MVHDSVQFID